MSAEIWINKLNDTIFFKNYQTGCIYQTLQNILKQSLKGLISKFSFS